MLGKILFILYIIFLVYFLFLSDWYGREGVMDEYHYNLVLLKEIKRFIKYRHQLGIICGVLKFVWKYSDFHAGWLFFGNGREKKKLF